MRSKPRKPSIDKRDWHLWFAWRPVVVKFINGTWCWVWLEDVERRVVENGLDWKTEYRLPNGDLVRHRS